MFLTHEFAIKSRPFTYIKFHPTRMNIEVIKGQLLQPGFELMHSVSCDLMIIWQIIYHHHGINYIGQNYAD